MPRKPRPGKRVALFWRPAWSINALLSGALPPIPDTLYQTKAKAMEAVLEIGRTVGYFPMVERVEFSHALDGLGGLDEHCRDVDHQYGPKEPPPKSHPAYERKRMLGRDDPPQNWQSKSELTPVELACKHEDKRVMNKGGDRDRELMICSDCGAFRARQTLRVKDGTGDRVIGEWSLWQTASKLRT